MAKFLQRQAATGRPERNTEAVDDPTMAKGSPALLEFLTVTAWSPEEPRATGTLFIFHDGVSWKAMLKDRDAEKVAFVTGQSFQDVLRGCETGLRESRLDWRDDAKPARGRREK